LLKACTDMHVPRFVFLSSIAVTNHFEHSLNQSESDGLPPLDTLWSPYDRTKRLGEDMVLGANGQHGMATCALRAGGILLSPKDYTFRNYFMIPGVLLGIGNLRQIDFVAAQDVVRGILLAAKALESRPGDTCGEAFFLTKGESAEPSTLMYTAAEFLGWSTVNLPEVLFEMGCIGQKWFHQICEKMGLAMPGIPPHVFWKMGRIEQTFDNSKARDVLGYTPEVSLRESVGHICACHLRDLQKGYIRPMPWLAVFGRAKFWLAFWLAVLSLSALSAAHRS